MNTNVLRASFQLLSLRNNKLSLYFHYYDFILSLYSTFVSRVIQSKENIVAFRKFTHLTYVFGKKVFLTQDL